MNLYGKNYKLVWEDNFDGKELNPKWWNVKNYFVEGHEGRKAWRKPENCTLEDGNLVIRGKIEENGDYTSGMINTAQAFSYQYGYCEIRAKLPLAGPGRWPGFWMCCPQHPGRKAGSEIDIFEMFGDDTFIACNVHEWWHDECGAGNHHINFLDGQNYPKKIVLPDGKKFSDDFHTIGYEWTPELVAFFVDGEPYCTIRVDNPVYKFVDQPVYFIISMAYGLKHLKQPLENSTPVEYYIDYIRLYQNETGKIFKINAEEKTIEQIKSVYDL